MRMAQWLYALFSSLVCSLPKYIKDGFFPQRYDTLARFPPDGHFCRDKHESSTAISPLNGSRLRIPPPALLVYRYLLVSSQHSTSPSSVYPHLPDSMILNRACCQFCCQGCGGNGLERRAEQQWIFGSAVKLIADIWKERSHAFLWLPLFHSSGLSSSGSGFGEERSASTSYSL